MEMFFGVAGLVITIIGIALERGWLPPEYHMLDSNPLNDPVTAPIFGPGATFHASPRRARVVLRHAVAKHRADGFRVVRVAFGRECRWGRRCSWEGKSNGDALERGVLMARPSDTVIRTHPKHTSGRGPVWVGSIDSLPHGIDAARVAWARASKVDDPAGRRRRPVLDAEGREWRIRDRLENLVLVWKDDPDRAV
jgi:hypothetical protein